MMIKMMIKIEFTIPLSQTAKLTPFKKGFKKSCLMAPGSITLLIHSTRSFPCRDNNLSISAITLHN